MTPPTDAPDLRIEPEDIAHLRALAELTAPHAEAIGARYLHSLRQAPGAAGMLADRAQDARLHDTFLRWLDTLFAGSYGPAYREDRRRIGKAHMTLGLPQEVILGAMHDVREAIQDLLWDLLPTARLRPSLRALNRVADLDVALIISAYTEAHERHELRSLQAIIVENMPVTVLCLDAHGRVQAATRPDSRLFGELDPIDQHYERFLPEPFVEATDLPTHVGHALATHHEITIPRVVLGEGPDARVFRVTLVPLQHELARLLLHVEELTDVVHAEARLQQAQALARVGSLAANVAHEIRNPLAAISATLQVIHGTLDASDGRRGVLDKVQDQVHRMDHLVSDLLSFAHPARPTPQRVLAAPLARQAIRESGVDASVVEESPLVLLADPGQVVRVLINLLQNARDASQPGQEIRVELGTDGLLCVVDCGSGVPVAARRRLFEPFFTTKARGTGLGLAISRKLAESMGGALRWTPGSPGSRFCLKLPSAPPADRASSSGSAGRSD